MPKRVTEHEMPDAQPLCLGRHPGRNAHCFPDVFVHLPGRLEMIDEGDPVESAGFGMLGAVHDVGSRQPHLRQEQIPLDHRPPRHVLAVRVCAAVASLLFLLC